MANEEPILHGASGRDGSAFRARRAVQFLVAAASVALLVSACSSDTQSTRVTADASTNTGGLGSGGLLTDSSTGGGADASGGTGTGGAAGSGGAGTGGAASDAGTDAAVSISLGVTGPANILIAQGGTALLTVSVQRNGFTDPVQIGLSSVPNGVLASTIVIPSGTSVGSLSLLASDAALLGTTAVSIVATSGALSATAPLSVRVIGTDGTLDPTFGNGGKLTLDIDPSQSLLEAVSVQADGRIVVAGSTGLLGTKDALVARLHPDGSLDTSFGNGGTLIIDAGLDEHCTGVVTLASGRILFSFVSFRIADAGFTLDSYVRLVDSSGAPVTTDSVFGSTGELDFPGESPGNIVSLGGDSAAYAVGSVGVYQPPNQTQLTFPGLSADHVAAGGNSLFVAGLALFPSNAVAVGRFVNQGTYQMDGAFGAGTGRVVLDALTPGSSRVTSVTVDGNGSAVVSIADGTTNVDFVVARVTSSGVRDPSFGAGAGYVTTDFSGGADLASDVRLIGTNLVVVGGASMGSTGEDFALARYFDSGDLVPAFGLDGRATTDFSGGDDRALGAALDGQGHLVAVGYATSAGRLTAAVARYRMQP